MSKRRELLCVWQGHYLHQPKVRPEKPTWGAHLRIRLRCKAQIHVSTEGAVWRRYKEGRRQGKGARADASTLPSGICVPSSPGPGLGYCGRSGYWGRAETHTAWTHRAGRHRRLDGRARAWYSRWSDTSPPCPLSATDASSATRNHAGAERESGRLDGRA